MNRRQFLIVVITSIIGVFSIKLKRLFGITSGNGIAESNIVSVFMPIVSQRQVKLIGPRVIHVHSENATNWDGTDPYYWNYIDQEVVDEMVDQGLIFLTSTNNITDAWRTLLPNFLSGENIAIKASFNNSKDCNNIDDQIDSVIEPFNAVIRGLKLIGVPESSIWIYDAVRSVPHRFRDDCAYSGVRFFDDGCDEVATFISSDPNAIITFNPPENIGPLPSIRVNDVLINADYLINIPVMKHHDGAGVSLGFKNHFGTIDHPSDLHPYIGRSASATYDAQVDVFNNPHIRFKTILTLGDGLFSALMNYDPPSLWSTFGNQVPKSLFFSVDPVAIDSVMCDFLDAEKTLPDFARWHLALASRAGMGIFEIGDPWDSGYQEIDYLKLEL